MTGYDELSTLIGSYPELAIFRRFGSLSAKVLLCMQAELLDLEDDLNIISEVNRKDTEKRGLLRSWAKTNAASSEDGADWRKRKMVDAREKLVGYYSLVLQMNKIHRIKSPQPRDLESLKRWLASEEGGNHFLAAAGIEAKAWDVQGADLMALGSQDDLFAQWMVKTFLSTYHRHIGHRFHKEERNDDLGDLWHYEYTPFTILADVLCALLSSMLPSCCIFVLYYIERTPVRLALIACSSFVFALVMAFVFKARRQDIFAATTALAAVQVVFVGGVNITDITLKQNC